MALMPNEIKDKEFEVKLRGYDPFEVKAYLAQVAQDYETLYRQVGETNQRVRMLEQQVGQYKVMEKTLRETMITAQTNAKELVDAAHRRAQSIEREAEEKRRRIVENATENIYKLQREYEDLRLRVKNYHSRYVSMVEAERSMLTEIEKRYVLTSGENSENISGYIVDSTDVREHVDDILRDSDAELQRIKNQPAQPVPQQPMYQSAPQQPVQPTPQPAPQQMAQPVQAMPQQQPVQSTPQYQMPQMQQPAAQPVIMPEPQQGNDYPTDGFEFGAEPMQQPVQPMGSNLDSDYSSYGFGQNDSADMGFGQSKNAFGFEVQPEENNAYDAYNENSYYDVSGAADYSNGGDMFGFNDNQQSMYDTDMPQGDAFNFGGEMTGNDSFDTGNNDFFGAYDAEPQPEQPQVMQPVYDNFGVQQPVMQPQMSQPAQQNAYDNSNVQQPRVQQASFRPVSANPQPQAPAYSQQQPMQPAQPVQPTPQPAPQQMAQPVQAMPQQQPVQSTPQYQMPQMQQPAAQPVIMPEPQQGNDYPTDGFEFGAEPMQQPVQPMGSNLDSDYSSYGFGQNDSADMGFGQSKNAFGFEVQPEENNAYDAYNENSYYDVSGAADYSNGGDMFGFNDNQQSMYDTDMPQGDAFNFGGEMTGNDSFDTGNNDFFGAYDAEPQPEQPQVMQPVYDNFGVQQPVMQPQMSQPAQQNAYDNSNVQQPRVQQASFRPVSANPQPQAPAYSQQQPMQPAQPVQPVQQDASFTPQQPDNGFMTENNDYMFDNRNYQQPNAQGYNGGYQQQGGNSNYRRRTSYRRR